MPNWVTNIVKMNDIVRTGIIQYDGTAYFDFNTLVPMPETLLMDYGSMTDLSIVYYLTNRLHVKCFKDLPAKRRDIARKCLTGACDADLVFNNAVKRIYEWYGDYTKEQFEKLYIDGQQYVYNKLHYGHTTWYGWSYENWGTKWNSCQLQVLDYDTIRFDTAWNAPIEITLALSNKFPTQKITHIWADEDSGYNTGSIVVLNGVIVKDELILDATPEAYQIYNICTDCYPIKPIYYTWSKPFIRDSYSPFIRF